MLQPLGLFVPYTAKVQVDFRCLRAERRTIGMCMAGCAQRDFPPPCKMRSYAAMQTTHHTRRPWMAYPIAFLVGAGLAWKQVVGFR